MTNHDLYVLPGATIREGMENLRASQLAPVVPIRPILDDTEGKRAGHRHDHEQSGATCTCTEDVWDEWFGVPCPIHEAPAYAAVTRRREPGAACTCGVQTCERHGVSA